LKQIKRLGLEQNVFLPGALSAEQLAERMQQSHAMIHASFVESYSLALAESMVVGVPNVVAWSGAMPELSTDNRDALFYSPTDYCKCAWLVGRLVEDTDLAQRLSSEARSRALLRNATAAVVDHQVDTYRWVLEGNR
jgi:glycosyltransferase involved in cell wall biosynthesis